MKVTKEQIIQKALFYFAEHDYERSSLNDIARALDITKGGIYHYFGSKDDLFREAAIYGLRRAVDIFDPDVPNISVRELIQFFFSPVELSDELAKHIGFNFFREYDKILYLVIASLKKFDEVREELHSLFSLILSRLERRITQAQEAGTIKQDLNPGVLAYEIVAYSEGSMLIGSILEKENTSKKGEEVFASLWKRIAV